MDRVSRSSLETGPIADVDPGNSQREQGGNPPNTLAEQVLSKDKRIGCGLAKHEKAEALLQTGMMDFGGEMAFVNPYERRKLPTR